MKYILIITMTFVLLVAMLVAFITLTPVGDRVRAYLSPKTDDDHSSVGIWESMDEVDLQSFDIRIPAGGSIFSELTKIKIPPQKIGELVGVFGYNVDARSLQPGDHFIVVMDHISNNVVEFHYLPDPVSTHSIVLNPETMRYEYTLSEKPITTKMRVVEGVVYTTLAKALEDNNVDNVVRHVMANALSSRINFAAHTRVGDTFKVMYEERFLDGVKVGGTRMFYMAYSGRNTGFHEGFRYQEADEKSAFNGFYTPTGIAMVNASYRPPLDRIHVTSTYGNRIHPITGRRQMHYGVDYRATTGTPVYAVAAGRVVMAGRNGGFGNTVEINHGNNIVTQYAHLHRINVRNGQNVSRGTVIGTVGSTGLSTGPHLHFGLRINGRYSNPSNLRMVAASRLEGKRLEDLKTQIPIIRSTLHRVENEALSPFDMTPMERFRRANARTA
jgi:murein DD-endopeptidase MepM/ murein hydrolase activator NlpD